MVEKRPSDVGHICKIGLKNDHKPNLHQRKPLFWRENVTFVIFFRLFLQNIREGDEREADSTVEAPHLHPLHHLLHLADHHAALQG